MLLVLRNDHKEHLQFLITQPEQLIVDFCKLAMDFLHNGYNHKRYNTASEKIGVPVETIQNCVYGLINLLLLSCKHQISDADFMDTVLTLGFSEEQQAVLSKFYESKAAEIKEFLQQHLSEFHYDNLRWRFEAQVSSRCLLEQITPLIAMELVLKKDDDGVESEKQNILLQTDPNNLLHVADELERALNEAKSRHSRKILRILKN